MRITFRHSFNADRCFDIRDASSRTVKSLFGEMAPLLFTFLIDVHILGGDEVIEAGALVTYYIQPVQVQMFLYDDRDKADLMVKLDIDAPVRTLTTPKDMNKKQHTYKLSELCAAILPYLEAAILPVDHQRHPPADVRGSRRQARRAARDE